MFRIYQMIFFLVSKKGHTIRHCPHRLLLTTASGHAAEMPYRLSVKNRKLEPTVLALQIEDWQSVVTS